MSTIKLSSDRAAAVEQTIFWTEITPTCKPVLGARYQLIRKDAGVAQIAPFRDDGWYTHFAGLPKFQKPGETPVTVAALQAEVADLKAQVANLRRLLAQSEDAYRSLQLELTYGRFTDEA